jgi:HSP20 family protein
MNKQIDIKHTSNPVSAVSDSWKTFRQQFDRLFDRFSDGFDTFAIKPFNDLENLWSKNLSGFAPLAVDVSETDKTYTITAELPGVDEKDVDVSVADGTLVIKGEKRQNREEKSKNHYLSERSYGAFQRMFGLPKGTEEGKVEATFHNGVLSVTIPKPMETPARKVEVKAT